ncbi:MAG: nuclear transport factor 2 family protein [Bryobacter sp.]|nr:nuclear transport factor 2 family protein [Bryobacter sp.]
MRMVLLLLAAALYASEAEIEAAEKKFAAAIQAKDAKTLRALFAEQLIYAHATGKIETKDEYLTRLSAGKQRYDSYQIERMKVVLYDQSAVSHLTVRVTGQNDAGPFNDHVLMLHHWVKRNGGWMLVAHQTAKIP